MAQPSKTSWFTRFAKTASYVTGRPVTFMIALGIILAWGLSGRFFGYSDTWQLVINTSTTIVTFLMVFLIQNTQNRDAETLQIKLDELIRAVDKAQNELLDIEELDDDQIHKLLSQYEGMGQKARDQLKHAESDLKQAEDDPQAGPAVKKAEEEVEQAESDLDAPESSKEKRAP